MSKTISLLVHQLKRKRSIKTDTMACITLDLAHTLGKRWSIVLLEEIAIGHFDGFNTTLKKSGLTPKILSLQLKELERLQLIEKTKAKPSAYRVTPKGTEYRTIVRQIKLFGYKWGDTPVDCQHTSCLECSRLEK